MTADTKLVRMIEKHCDFIRVDSVTQEVRHYLFTPAQIEILAAALQGRGTQEGEPSDARVLRALDTYYQHTAGAYGYSEALISRMRAALAKESRVSVEIREAM